MRLLPMRRPYFRYEVRALAENLIEKTGVQTLKRLFVVGSKVPKIEIGDGQLAAVYIKDAKSVSAQNLEKLCEIKLTGPLVEYLFGARTRSYVLHQSRFPGPQLSR